MKTDWAKLDGKVFRSAAEIGIRSIAKQPGYRRGQDMSVRKTSAGGYRLYVLVAGKWMDASLQDLA